MRHISKLKDSGVICIAIDADGHTLDIWLRKNEIINQHMRLLSALLNNSVNLK